MNWMRELGLSYNPFDKALTASGDIFESRDLIRAQDAISEAVMQRQMLVMIAPVGAGKTTVTFNLLLANDPHLLLVRDVTLSWETLNINQIEEAILNAIFERDSSVREPLKRSGNSRYHQLRRVLGKFTEGHEVVLVLEDGHRIPGATLVNLKRLRELRFGLQERLLTIIVLAQPPMRMRIRELREVDLRSQIYEMEGLSREEVLAYIEQRMRNAGVKASELFEKPALAVLADTLHWPLEINKVCEKLLRDAVEVGMIPVTADLARKYCNARTQLTALWIASQMSLSEICQELARKQVAASRVTIQRALHGLEVNDSKLVGQIREILLPLAGDMAVLYDPQRPGLTEGQSRMLEECNRTIGSLGENLNWTDFSRRTELTHSRLYELLRGVQVSQSELENVHRYLQRQAKKAA